MKKIIILMLFITLIISGCSARSKKAANAPVKTVDNERPVVGGDKDAHGCIGSAGYTWCESKNKCLRIWEEKCEAITTGAHGRKEPVPVRSDETPKMCTQEAKVCPDGSSVGRTGPNCEFAACPTKKCSECPFLSKPGPSFCPNGTIVPGPKDACGCQTPPTCKDNNAEEGNSGNAGMANPASTFCEEHGGKSVIVDNPDGSQSGNCILSNGKTCDEWAYFRGECK